MGVRFSSSVISMVPEARADTSNMTDAKYIAIASNATTEFGRVLEVYEGGEATSSTVNIMSFGRDSTIGATLSFATIAGFGPVTLDARSAVATQGVAFNTATTKPQRSATLGHLLTLSFNAFGGIVRWVAAPEEEINYYSNAASTNELSLSGFTGSGLGAMSAHIISEEF